MLKNRKKWSIKNIIDSNSRNDLLYTKTENKIVFR